MSDANRLIEAHSLIATANHAHAYVLARLRPELEAVRDTGAALRLYADEYAKVFPAFETMNRDGMERAFGDDAGLDEE